MKTSYVSISKELARAWMVWAFCVLVAASLLAVSWDANPFFVVLNGLFSVLAWLLPQLVAFEIWSSQHYVWISVYVALIFGVKFELGRSMAALVPEALNWLAGQPVSEADLAKARQHQHWANLMEKAQAVWIAVTVVGFFISSAGKSAAGLGLNMEQTLLHVGIFLVCILIGFKRTALVVPPSLANGATLDRAVLKSLVVTYGYDERENIYPGGDWFYHDSLLLLLSRQQTATTLVAEAKDHLDEDLYEAWTKERAHG